MKVTIGIDRGAGFGYSGWLVVRLLNDEGEVVSESNLSLSELADALRLGAIQ